MAYGGTRSSTEQLMLYLRAPAFSSIARSRFPCFQTCLVSSRDLTCLMLLTGESDGHVAARAHDRGRGRDFSGDWCRAKRGDYRASILCQAVCAVSEAGLAVWITVLELGFNLKLSESLRYCHCVKPSTLKYKRVTPCFARRQSRCRAHLIPFRKRLSHLASSARPGSPAAVPVRMRVDEANGRHSETTSRINGDQMELDQLSCQRRQSPAPSQQARLA
eukprot:1255483-Rhodomonas_salina.1